jgi:S-adenosylmethionine:tRNA ribosyltransferase-isomerase
MQAASDAHDGRMRETASYDYALPEELIAREPASQRDASRLLVVAPDGSLHDRIFTEFPALLQPGDVLVINETRVIPARLHGHRPGGGAMEALLLRPRSGEFTYAAREWFALVRPGRRLGIGVRVRFGSAEATIVDVLEDGPRVLRFDDGVDIAALLAAHGEVPLPPYVGAGDAARDARYQTVFARVPGSVAAPTASLHFTPQTLAAIVERGVTIAPLTLDVGIGTFRPLATASLDAHVMHAERYAIPPQTVAAIAAARARGGRIVAAGTTVVRALEGSASKHGEVVAGSDETSLFITPGFSFHVVDALLTNFHLPCSTLLVLVATFAGYDITRRAYAEAVARRYHFFSFGDAMFVQRVGQRATFPED